MKPNQDSQAKLYRIAFDHNRHDVDLFSSASSNLAEVAVDYLTKRHFILASRNVEVESIIHRSYWKEEYWNGIISFKCKPGELGQPPVRIIVTKVNSEN